MSSVAITWIELRLLPAQDSRAYEERATKELGAESAHWLTTGER